MIKSIGIHDLFNVHYSAGIRRMILELRRDATIVEKSASVESLVGICDDNISKSLSLLIMHLR